MSEIKVIKAIYALKQVIKEFSSRSKNKRVYRDIRNSMLWGVPYLNTTLQYLTSTLKAVNSHSSVGVLVGHHQE